ncbi:hypothetical protein UCRPC4_g06148 [Phaeomoniella chlamydospora]|uniref:Uncharacterized protein n=1 Tax=Phaeomoniella chlamydospora TaxID=158046 RepID=A0A0G2DXZ5_PHACM|nr:hypothetical protein UCRPC4_g06148 [Phaeomoniella chlamydospora]
MQFLNNILRPTRTAEQQQSAEQAAALLTNVSNTQSTPVLLPSSEVIGKKRKIKDTSTGGERSTTKRSVISSITSVVPDTKLRRTNKQRTTTTTRSTRSTNVFDVGEESPQLRSSANQARRSDEKRPSTLRQEASDAIQVGDALNSQRSSPTAHQSVEEETAGDSPAARTRAKTNRDVNGTTQTGARAQRIAARDKVKRNTKPPKRGQRNPIRRGNLSDPNEAGLIARTNERTDEGHNESLPTHSFRGGNHGKFSSNPTSTPKDHIEGTTKARSSRRSVATNRRHGSQEQSQATESYQANPNDTDGASIEEQYETESHPEIEAEGSVREEWPSDETNRKETLESEDEKICEKQKHRLDQLRFRAAIGGTNTSNLWYKFHRTLADIYEGRQHHEKSMRSSANAKQLLKCVKKVEFAYFKLEKLNQGSSEASEAATTIKDGLYRIQELETHLKQNKPGREQNDNNEGTIIHDIYVQIIPKIGRLLRTALVAWWSPEGEELNNEGIRDLVIVAGILLRLCDKAEGWKPRPSLTPLNRLTRSLRRRTSELAKFYKKEYRYIQFRERQQVELEERRKFRAGFEAKETERMHRRLIEGEEYWVRIWTSLTASSSSSQRIQAGRNNEQSRMGSLSITIDEAENDEDTPLTPPHGHVSHSSGIGEENSPLVRTPLSVRGRRGSDEVSVATELPTQSLGKVSEWTQVEEEALLNGLQEFQGVSRYFDIFEAYSGRELARRDMDAIKRKAKTMKAALINELKGTGIYDEFEFLWSVSD